MITYLARYKEDMPKWLREYSPGARPSFAKVLSSRVLYYPGSGFDGEPVETFNRAHACHCFIYVDGLYTKAGIFDEIANRYHGFKGYHILGKVGYTLKGIWPEGYVPTIPDGYELKGESEPIMADVAPFCLMVVMERDFGLDDSYGSERFAVVFLKADGIMSYQMLFGASGWGGIQNGGRGKGPWALVLQDHCFGGNYDVFGADGLMEAIADESHAYPSLALVADYTVPWKSMCKICGVPYVVGGMHSNQRSLFIKRIEVVAAMIVSSGKVFATQRGYGEYKDFWEFPGGKMERGESPEAALRREIQEELATSIAVDGHVCTIEYDYPAFHLTMHCFLCHVLEGDLELLEAEDARWLDIAHLDSVNWLPADLQILPRLAEVLAKH